MVQVLLRRVVLFLTPGLCPVDAHRGVTFSTFLIEKCSFLGYIPMVLNIPDRCDSSLMTATREHNPGCPEQGKTFPNNTPEESDDSQTPMKTGLILPFPDGK